MKSGNRNLKWIVAVLLAGILLAAKAAFSGVIIEDSLSKAGGQMRGSIKRVYPSGTDASLLQMYSFGSEVNPESVIGNETLRVMRIWNDRGTPRIDLRNQGAAVPGVRISSRAVEMPVMVMLPQATPPTPVVGGMYVSTSGAIYICGSLATGWELMN